MATAAGTSNLRSHLASAGWFLAWAFLGMLGPVTLGLAFTWYVIIPFPIAVVLFVVLVTRQQALSSAFGLGWGLGAPLLLFAWVNRAGPGNVCTVTGTGSSCTQEINPWPVLAIGLALMVASVVAHTQRHRLVHHRPRPQPQFGPPPSWPAPPPPPG